MKVNTDCDISFKGFYNNKILKKGLEFAADNGALFAAGSMMGFSLCVRPLSISMTPNVSKENKTIACLKSIASSFTGFLIMLLLSGNIAKSIKKIDKNPEKYLKTSTINNLKEKNKDLYQSKAYIIATQSFKLGIGLLAAIPKALLTSWGVSVLYDKVSEKEKRHTNIQNKLNITEEINFKSKNNDKLTKNIAKIINNKKFQDFANKFKNSNFVMHIISLTDALTTLTFVHNINKTTNINEKRKKALSLNSLFSTFLSITCSYILNDLTNNSTEKFIKKYKEINKFDKNLKKQIEGIRVAKPILLTGCVYYILIPFIATFFAEIAERNKKFDITKKI